MASEARSRLSRFFHSSIVLTTLIVAGATLWLYGPVFRGEVPLPTQSVTGLTWGQPTAAPVPSIFRDRIVQAYPYHLWAATEIQHGRFPWWNNLIFAGTTFFANGQSGLFSLFQLPWWWLPPIISYEIVTLLQSIVAAIGFAMLAKKLRWHPAAGIAMALAFTLSAPFVMRMTVTTMSAVFAVLPFVLWSILRLHERLTLRRVISVALLIAAMIFAGHVQLAAFAIGISIIWIASWWRAEQWRRRLIYFALALALGVAVTAVQLFPLRDALNQAYRQPHTLTWAQALKPSRLFRVSVTDAAASLTMVDQNAWGAEAHYHGPANYLEGNLYLGPVAILLALASLWSWRRRAWRWLVVVTLINGGLFVFPGWWDLIGKLAPWLTVTPVWRTSFVLAFLISVLAGFGMDEFTRRRWSRYAWLVVGLMAVIPLWQWWGILPFAPKATLFPPSTILSTAASMTADGSRVWTPNGVLDQFMAYHVPISVGYDSVYPSLYLELWTANSERIEKRNQLVPVNPNDAVLRATASNLIITKDPLPSGWELVMTEGIWHLGRRLDPTPAVHTVVDLVSSDQAADLNGVDLGSQALIAGPAPSIGPRASVERVTKRTATLLQAKVTGGDQTVVVTNLQWYRGWRLKIDGQETPAALKRVNYAFLGAVVPAGDHTLEWYYAPDSFRQGLIVSIVAAALLLVGWFARRKTTAAR